MSAWKKISFGNIYVENVFEFVSSIAVHESKKKPKTDKLI